MKHRLKRRVIDGIEEKQCMGCRRWLAENLSNFYASSRTGDFQGQCKACFIKGVQIRQRNISDVDTADRLIKMIVNNLCIKKPKQPYRRNRRGLLRYTVVSPRHRRLTPLCISRGEALWYATVVLCRGYRVPLDRRRWQEFKQRGYYLVDRYAQDEITAV